MRIIKSFSICSILLIGLFGTAYSEPNSLAYKSPDLELKPKEFILMIPSGSIYNEYSGFNINLDIGGGYADLLSLTDQSLINQCVPKNGQKDLLGGVGAAIVGIFAKVFIQNAFTAGEEKLAKKLEKYQSTYQANLTLRPSTTKCVRFVRGTATATTFKTDFDLVLKLEPSLQHSMMQMKVLKIETGKAKALGKVSYAVSAQYSGFYIDQNNIGQSISYDEQIVHTGKYGADKLPEACLIKAHGDWDACAAVYAYPGLNTARGVANLTLKVTEVGSDKRKGKLENWRKFLGQIKGDVGDTLSGAITELLE